MSKPQLPASEVRTLGEFIEVMFRQPEAPGTRVTGKRPLPLRPDGGAREGHETGDTDAPVSRGDAGTVRA